MNADTSLQADALRLASLGREMVVAAFERKFEDFRVTASDYLTLRDSLKTRLLSQSTVFVDDAYAAEVLQKIIADEGLPSDEVVRKLSSLMGDPVDIDEIDHDELERLGSSLY
jgi:hypothetical protein